MRPRPPCGPLNELRHGIRRDAREHVSGLAQDVEFNLVLDEAGPFDDALRRNQDRTRQLGGQRRGRLAGRRRRQPVESKDRHGGRFDPDALSSLTFEELNERVVLARLGLDDGHRPQVGMPVGQRTRRRHVPEIDDERDAERVDRERAGRTAESAQVEKIWRVRDDEGVEAHLLDHRADEREPGCKRKPERGMTCPSWRIGRESVLLAKDGSEQTFEGRERRVRFHFHFGLRVNGRDVMPRHELESRPRFRRTLGQIELRKRFRLGLANGLRLGSGSVQARASARPPFPLRSRLDRPPRAGAIAAKSDRPPPRSPCRASPRGARTCTARALRAIRRGDDGFLRGRGWRRGFPVPLAGHAGVRLSPRRSARARAARARA